MHLYNYWLDIRIRFDGCDGACSGLPDVMTSVIPSSVDIRTLSRDGNFSSGDPLCELTPRPENLLTLDYDLSDAFGSLNVWLEVTVRRPSRDLHPTSISTLSLFPFFFCSVLPFFVGHFAYCRHAPGLTAA